MNKKRLLILLTLLLLLGGAFFVFFVNRRADAPSQTVFPTPTVVLTESQKNIPTAKPQTFSEEQINAAGILIVTSVPEGVRVVLDTPDGETSQNTSFLPINTTPFRIEKIPPGEYGFFAAKEGYEIKEGVISITSGTITTLTISLVPIIK